MANGRVLLIRGREWAILESASVTEALEKLRRDRIDTRSAEVGFTDPLTNTFCIIDARRYIKEYENVKLNWWQR